MPATVVVNFMTVVHQASSGTSPSFPDVCKTPSPAGPVPIPYPNVAMSSDTADGSSTVKMDGNPIMLKSSNYATSTGDEAGTAGGGVVSAKTKGKAYPQMYSMDVKVDGDNVFRLLDIMLQNGGSPTNTPPGTNLQPPNNALPTSQSPKNYLVKSVKWDQEEACCGDEVSASIETQDLDGWILSMSVIRVAKTFESIATVRAPISGDKSNPKWLVIRGPYDMPVKMNAKITGPGGPKYASNRLTVKTVAEQKEFVHGNRSTPQYVANTGPGPAWVPNGKSYGWPYAYDIEIKQGSLVITRKIEFQLKNGANPTADMLDQWRTEIELIWDNKYCFHRQNCKRGANCACPGWGCCRFPIRILAMYDGGHGKKVTLFKGANDPNGWGKQNAWWYSHMWWERRDNVPWTVRAHEFGHLIGMYDEYPQGACDPARQYTNDPTCIMNSGKKFYARHLTDFYSWFKGKAESIIGDVFYEPT